jgi:flagellar biosynthetic protein FlhB
MMAPVVLAMGKGMLAKRICLLARRHQVPIVRRPPVARALAAQCSINSPIPDSSQAEVAHIYRWIITLPGNKVIAV